MVAPACTRSAFEEAEFWRSCAQRLGAENEQLAAENTTLAGTVAAQREQITALRQRVVTLSRMLFGKSSEKSGPGQQDAGGDGPAGGGDDSRGGSGRPAGGRRRGQRPGSAGHGRRRREHLDSEEYIHDIPEDQRRGPRGGHPYQLLGGDASEQVSWRVRVWRVVVRRRKYARSCRCPVPAVVTAPGPPKLTGRGGVSTEFCVNLLIAKYALGLPFNRVIAMLSFQGLQVAPGTLAGVARRLDEFLAPLAAAITARNAAAGHAHADETSWRVFGQPADNGGDRWWLWVFTTADTVVYTMRMTVNAWRPRPRPAAYGRGGRAGRAGTALRRVRRLTALVTGAVTMAAMAMLAGGPVQAAAARGGAAGPDDGHERVVQRPGEDRVRQL